MSQAPTWVRIPYEEPAFDIYPVDNEIASLGLGRLGMLPEATPLAAFAAEVAAVLRLPSLRFAGDGSRSVRRVACLPGSGAEAIARGVAGVADVLVTGDVKYHEARAALSQGLALIDAPHDLTEEEAVLRWSETLCRGVGRDWRTRGDAPSTGGHMANIRSRRVCRTSRLRNAGGNVPVGHAPGL